MPHPPVEKKIPLVEIFGPTIQGEGSIIGQQTYFLRFGLCDYRCTMCDSMHAVDPKQVKANAQWLPQEEIADRLEDYRAKIAPNSTRWVTFSGGNPLVHDLYPLVKHLHTLGWKISVETQGSLFDPWIYYVDLLTISPKGPGMGETCDLPTLDKFIDHIGRSAVGNRTSIKIVVFDERDLEFARMIAERYWIVHQLDIPFWLSLGNPWPPGFNSDDPLPEKPQLSESDPEHVERLVTRYKQLFNQIKDDKLLSRMRFLPQWHVIVYGNKQGV